MADVSMQVQTNGINGHHDGLADPRPARLSRPSALLANGQQAIPYIQPSRTGAFLLPRVVMSLLLMCRVCSQFHPFRSDGLL